MINSLIDLLMILISYTGYFFTHFTAFKMDVPMIPFVIGILFIFTSYFIFTFTGKKEKLAYMIVILLGIAILSPQWINGFKFHANIIFERYLAADKTFVVPYLNYDNNLNDLYLWLVVYNMISILILFHYYHQQKYLFIHYIPTIIFAFVPILFQYFPPYIYLILFVGALFSEYLTKNVGKITSLRLGILVVLIAVPVALQMNHDFTEDYEPLFHFEDLRMKINNAGKKINQEKELHTKLDLGELGARNPTDDIEYYVEGDYLGSYKIYGQRFALYNDNVWESITDTGIGELDSITLRILNLHYLHTPNSIRIYTPFHVLSNNYQPYYVSFHNEGSYTFISYEDIYHNNFDDLNITHIQAINRYAENHLEDYIHYPTRLDSPLTKALKEAKVNESDDVLTKVEKIHHYLTNNFRYTINTKVTPEGEDFVAYFLKTKEGYCVHFATTATLLLRKAGIMSRYVEGYQLSEYEDGQYIARNKDAHAWVEYFDPKVGWLPYEMTTAYSKDDMIATYHKIEYHPSDEQEENQEDIENDPIIPIVDPSKQQENTQTNEEVKNNSFHFYYLIPVILVLVVVGIRIYRQLQFNRYKKQSNKQYILFLYHQLDNLHIKVEKDYQDLALKAMYSNEIITNEEMKEFEKYFTTKIIQKEKWYITYYYQLRGKEYD